MEQKIVLGIRETTFGGGSPDAIVRINNGKIESIEYTNDKVENLAWSHGPGWADELIGQSPECLQEFIDCFFGGFEDDHRNPIVRSWNV